MTEKRSKVLLAGIGRGPFEAIAPVLDKMGENVDLRVQGVEVDRAVFAMLLEGFDTRTRRYRKHFGRDLRIRERVDDHGSECTA